MSYASIFTYTSGFRLLREKEIKKIDLAKYKEDSKKDVILEVDLEYPQELHDLHNEYPFGTRKNQSYSYTPIQV